MVISAATAPWRASDQRTPTLVPPAVCIRAGEAGVCALQRRADAPKPPLRAGVTHGGVRAGALITSSPVSGDAAVLGYQVVTHGGLIELQLPRRGREAAGALDGEEHAEIGPIEHDVGPFHHTRRRRWAWHDIGSSARSRAAATWSPNLPAEGEHIQSALIALQKTTRRRAPPGVSSSAGAGRSGFRGSTWRSFTIHTIPGTTSAALAATPASPMASNLPPIPLP